MRRTQPAAVPVRVLHRAFVVAAVLTSACARPAELTPPKILLISIDTTRADHLSAYGYGRRTSPFLAELAREGIRFENAYATMPTTDPSHASMLTGQHPRTHGIMRNADRRTDPSAPTIASWLADRGYATAAVTARLGLHPTHRGLAGFEHEDAPELPARARTAAQVVERVATWLDALPRSTRGWFLWAHLWEPHKPYEPSAEDVSALSVGASLKVAGAADPPRFLEPGRRLDDSVVLAAKARYDAEIHAADAAVRRIVELARSAPPDGRAPLVFVVSDHGESLGERQSSRAVGFGHGALLHDDVLRVPWIVYWPDRVRPRVVDTPVSLVDLAATLTDLVDPGAGFPTEGRSLAPAMIEGGAVVAEPVFAERRPFDSRPIERLAHPEAAILDYPWKLIDNRGGPRPELYRLDVDPGERVDVAAENARRAQVLLARLRAWKGARPVDTAVRGPGRRRRAELEALRELGYID